MASELETIHEQGMDSPHGGDCHKNLRPCSVGHDAFMMLIKMKIAMRRKGLEVMPAMSCLCFPRFPARFMSSRVCSSVVMDSQYVRPFRCARRRRG